MGDPPPFEGFPREGLEFLADLERENTRDFFQANRELYTESVATPAKAFVADLLLALRENVSEGIEGDPRVGKSLFRINRDLRFSKDKTPYKPRIDCVFWEGGEPRRSPSLFIRVRAGYVALGAGLMHPEPAKLKAFRDAVAAEESGVQLSAILVHLTDAAPSVTIPEATRVRVPRGYPADHPREALLRLDGIHASIQADHPTTIHEAAFVDWCAERYRPFAPLHHWLVTAIQE